MVPTHPYLVVRNVDYLPFYMVWSTETVFAILETLQYLPQSFVCSKNFKLSDE